MRSNFKSNLSAYASESGQNIEFQKKAEKIASRDFKEKSLTPAEAGGSSQKLPEKIKIAEPDDYLEKEDKNGIKKTKETPRHTYSLEEVYQFLLENNPVNTEMPLFKMVYPEGIAAHQRDKLRNRMVVGGLIKIVGSGGRSPICKIIKK